MTPGTKMRLPQPTLACQRCTFRVPDILQNRFRFRNKEARALPKGVTRNASEKKFFDERLFNYYETFGALLRYNNYRSIP
jgi:hypothetical protein